MEPSIDPSVQTGLTSAVPLPEEGRHNVNVRHPIIKISIIASDGWLTKFWEASSLPQRGLSFLLQCISPLLAQSAPAIGIFAELQVAESRHQGNRTPRNVL
jgi:hypothetical protein